MRLVPLTPADSSAKTLPGAPMPGFVPRTPPDESAVADVLARLDAALRASQSAAEMSAALTMSQKSARSRGLLAIVSTVAGIVYATIDGAREYYGGTDPPAIERRVDDLEDKVDAIAEDVAAIADALR